MTKILLDLNQEKVDELDRLQEELGIRTRKELFNNALTLFEWAIRERKAGRLIASVSKDHQDIKELTMPVFENINASSQPTEVELNSEQMAAFRKLQQNVREINQLQEMLIREGAVDESFFT